MAASEMTSKDFQDMLNVCGIALEINNPDEQLTEVLFLLEKIFRTGNNNFFFAGNHGQSLNLNRVISRGIERKYVSKFKQYYHKLDPFYKILSSDPMPTVVIRDHSKNRGKLLEYYSDFLKPQAIHHQMSIYLKNRQRFFGVLGLYRPPGSGGFSCCDQAKAAMLAPYLAGALEKAILTERKTKQDIVIDLLTAQIPYQGVIVLDGSLKPIYQSRHAARFLLDRECAKNEKREFPFPLPEPIYSHCRKLLMSDPANKNQNIPQKKIELDYSVNGKKNIIHLKRIICPPNTPLIVLYFSYADNECYLLKYGLSKRQAEVADLLNKGLTNKEIAKKLFISKYTVENHLKAIYKKMKVKTRTELSYHLR